MVRCTKRRVYTIVFETVTKANYTLDPLPGLKIRSASTSAIRLTALLLALHKVSTNAILSATVLLCNSLGSTILSRY